MSTRSIERCSGKDQELWSHVASFPVERALAWLWHGNNIQIQSGRSTTGDLIWNNIFLFGLTKKNYIPTYSLWTVKYPPSTPEASSSKRIVVKMSCIVKKTNNKKASWLRFTRYSLFFITGLMMIGGNWRAERTQKCAVRPQCYIDLTDIYLICA